jgi:two-component system cell cycle sensor histidine kinase/response regulator CckA
MRIGWGVKTPEANSISPSLLLEALGEPAAVCDRFGRVELSNAPWRAALDPLAGLVRGEGVFAAFRAAAQNGAGEGAIDWGGSSKPLAVTALSADRLLARVLERSPAPVAGPAEVIWPEDRDAVASAHFAVARLEGSSALCARVTVANAAFDALVGEAAAGRRLDELLHQVSPADDEAARPSAPVEVACVARPKVTAHLYLAKTGPGAWIAHLLDVTEQIAIQAQLAQHQKLEAVGHLASGVAHDFNNHLSGIRLQAQELLDSHPIGDPAYQGLCQIRQYVDRAADLVNKLVTFSRLATVQREVLQLDVALLDFEVFLRRLLREDVALETHYQSDLPTVRIDRGQLEAAVMNLVVNARDAIRAGGNRGRIRLEARRVAPLEAVALGYAGAPGGDLALIEVADDGPGMTSEVLQSVFEPFFTTKPVGEGTGLGLATVWGVVKQADGWVCAESAPGKGATFRIFLPPYEAPPAIEPPPAPPARPQRRDLSGQGRILLVEDEDLVRAITARLLRGRGYDVLEATDGEAALQIARENDGRIDLLISDVIMPGLDGPGLLAAAAPYLDSAPVIFMSGYAEADFSALLEAHPEVAFLPKPLDITTLADQVKRSLEARHLA